MASPTPVLVDPNILSRLVDAVAAASEAHSSAHPLLQIFVRTKRAAASAWLWGGSQFRCPEPMKGRSWRCPQHLVPRPVLVLWSVDIDRDMYQLIIN